MTRYLAALLTFVFFAFPAFADVEAIDNVVGQLDEAFDTQDADTLGELMTQDTLAVLPYRAAPMALDEQISLLPKSKIKQTDLREPTVVMLGPDSAMRTVTAKFEGSIDGKPMDEKVFATSILIKKGGKWLESFYQATPLAP